MKKVSITISWEEEKLSALRLYLAERKLKVEEELAKALEGLYAKTVPQPVQHFLELRGGTTVSPVSQKPKPEAKPRQEQPGPEKEGERNGR